MISANSKRLDRLQKTKANANALKEPQTVRDPQYSAETCCGIEKKEIGSRLQDSKTSGKVITLAEMSVLSSNEKQGEHTCGVCGQRYVQQPHAPGLFERLRDRFLGTRNVI